MWDTHCARNKGQSGLGLLVNEPDSVNGNCAFHPGFDYLSRNGVSALNLADLIISYFLQLSSYLSHFTFGVRVSNTVLKYKSSWCFPSSSHTSSHAGHMPQGKAHDIACPNMLHLFPLHSVFSHLRKHICMQDNAITLTSLQYIRVNHLYALVLKLLLITN